MYVWIFLVSGRARECNEMERSAVHKRLVCTRSYHVSRRLEQVGSQDMVVLIFLRVTEPILLCHPSR